MLAACSPQSTGASGAHDDADGGTTASPVGAGYANPDGVGIPVNPDSTEDVDVVVIGSGMGGFTAAMLTKEQDPDAKVVMLEKQDALGGNTNFAEGGAGFLNMSPEEARAAVQADMIQRNFVVDASLFYALRTQQGDCADWLFGKHGVRVKRLRQRAAPLRGRHRRIRHRNAHPAGRTAGRRHPHRLPRVRARFGRRVCRHRRAVQGFRQQCRPA